WPTSPAWIGPRPWEAPCTSSRSNNSSTHHSGAGGPASGAGSPRPLPAAPCPSRAVARGMTVSRMLGVVLAVLLLGGAASASHLKELRVCGDPDNLPLSHQHQAGVQNPVAHG